jgi:hypothetical protein
LSIAAFYCDADAEEQAMDRYDPIAYQSHSLLFLRPDLRMGFMDYMDHTVIRSVSALVPEKQYQEPIQQRHTWFCSAEIRCYDARDFVDSEKFAQAIWPQVRHVAIAFSKTLWAVDLAPTSEPKLADEAGGGEASPMSTD